MRRAVFAFAAVAPLLGAAGMSRAADKLDCNGPAYDEDLSNLALGVVTGGKVAFLANQSEKAKCPSADVACRRRAFLLDGNVVVIDIAPARTAYVCASFIDARGNQTDGWLPAASVTTVPVSPGWTGTWKRDTSATIDIKPAAQGKAEVSGEATWGTGGATHVGEIGGLIDPAAAVQGFGEDGDKQVAYEQAGPNDCAVRLKQLGPYLFAIDNDRCGGVNVSFTGLYRKR